MSVEGCPIFKIKVFLFLCVEGGQINDSSTSKLIVIWFEETFSSEREEQTIGLSIGITVVENCFVFLSKGNQLLR